MFQYCVNTLEYFIVSLCIALCNFVNKVMIGIILIPTESQSIQSRQADNEQSFIHYGHTTLSIHCGHREHHDVNT